MRLSSPLVCLEVFDYVLCIVCVVQEGAFALAFKSVHFPGEIVVARYDAFCDGDLLILSSCVCFHVVKAKY